MSAALATLVNGAPSDTVSSRDRGLQFGDGLFETLAVRDGAPLLWESHLARLSAGATRLGIPVPSAEILHLEVARLCHGHARAVLKIVVTRGVSGRGYACAPEAQPTRIVSVSAWPDYPSTNARDGVRVWLCRMRLGCNPALAGIKHLNRLEQVLARAERSDSHAEGLMCSTDGRVVEGTMSNLFAVVDGVLMTPDVSRCGVAGVVRGLILERAGGCHIGEIHASELKRASEVFLTNSLIGIWPVTAIEWAPGGDTAGRYAAGPITRQLQQRIADAVVSA